MRLKSIILELFILSVSCESNETSINSDTLLIVHWVTPSYNGETTTFKKGNALPNKAFGSWFQ